MTNKLLIIEDSSHKKSKIIEHLRSLDKDFEITEAVSFTSGWQALEEQPYDFVLLDMSLPTYDRNGAASGGRFRPFGGREIARKIIRHNIQTRIIFVTQYESFSDKGRSYSFETLKAELINECGKNFVSMIYYDSTKIAWKEQLSQAILGAEYENISS